MAKRFRSACSSTRASSIDFRSRPQRGFAAWSRRPASCVERWSTFVCANSSPGFAAMSKEQTKPSESLVQDLLAQRRELKVAVERLKLELADAQSNAGGPDPRLSELREEVERLRYQLASARAEVNRMREERDELRAGIEQALEKLSAAE